MALVSPGVSITVTDESQYISNAVGTVPLVLLATAQDKTINGALATGTTAANAGMLQVFGSQRELTTAMGTPTFQQTSAGTPLHGNELNEYGLMAAYSSLGLGNQLYAIRANIDLNELQGTSVRPTSAVANGTYWLDTTDTAWGIYEWSQSTQSFNVQTPIVITDITQTTSANTQGSLTSGYVYTPLTSVGSVGSYAVVVADPNGDNRTFYKAGSAIGSIDYNGLRNKWLLVGTPNWTASHPTVTATVTNPTINTIPYTYANLSINSTQVNIIVSTATVTTLANSINSTMITGVTADVVNGQLALYSTGANITISNSSVSTTSLLNAVGLTLGTYAAPAFQTYGVNGDTVGYGSFSAVPPWTNTVTGDINAPSGSVWFKQGATGGGTNFVIKEYNATTGLWNTQAVTSYARMADAIYGLDPVGGGQNIGVGTIVMRQDPNPLSTSTLGYAGYQARVRTVSGAVSATGTATNPIFWSGTALTFKVTQPGTNVVTQANVSIGTAFGGTYGNNKDFVAAVSAANLPNVTALVNSNGTITLTHTAGGDIVMSYLSGNINAAATAGFMSTSNWTPTVTNVFTVGTSYTTAVATVTGFGTLSYTYSSTQPAADPANGRLWYYSDPTQVDIMINTGTRWVGYQTGIVDARGYSLASGTLDPTGVIVAAAAPTTQTDNSSLAKGDLWLNTSDLENWPALSRWNGSSWVAIDNTDHISTNGIIFADARWDTGGYLDAASGTEATIQQLLTSNYLDLDAPNPLLYPRGMLMLNTRRSGYNVKKFVTNYFNTATFNVPTYSATTTYGLGAQVTTNGTSIYVSLTAGNLNNTPAVDSYGNPTASASWAPLETSTWVTASGLNTINNTPYAGHYAQRQIVVAAMKAALDANTQIREDQFAFSLICAPGYPELIPDMVSLNNDRSNTAFVIGDTPMGLSTNVVGLTNWSNDTNGTGLSVDDPYCAVYYPSGLSTDLAGNTIMVPPSHMALRTYLYNDNVAYPWFAPAGTRRGLVNNATDLGYVDYTSGEFVRTGVNQALRDSLYQLKINPITIIPGIGLVVWGQKTRDPNTESLDRVNVARLVNYIRTIFASSGNAFLFEPNDKITRDQFAAQLNRALNDLVAKRGIYDYLVVCDTTNNTPDRIANNQLYADVAIEPEKAVEFIYIPIRLFNPGEIAQLGSK